MAFILLWRGKYQGKCESVRNYILLGDSFQLPIHQFGVKAKFSFFLQWDVPVHLQVGVETTCDLSVRQLVT